MSTGRGCASPPIVRAGGRETILSERPDLLNTGLTGRRQVREPAGREPRLVRRRWCDELASAVGRSSRARPTAGRPSPQCRTPCSLQHRRRDPPWQPTAELHDGWKGGGLCALPSLHPRWSFFPTPTSLHEGHPQSTLLTVPNSSSRSVI